MRSTILVFIAFALISSCSNPVSRDRIGKIRSVHIFGNSIVKHGKVPEIGWFGDWGMAASAADSDFVHILMKKIHEMDTSILVRYSNISDFESDFNNYNLAKLDSFAGADMIIMRISENVKDSVYMDDFLHAYGNLIDHLDPENKSVKIITDGFWIRPNVNKSIKKYAKEKGYAFIKLDDLQKDSTNMAFGKFANQGIAFHPGDQGMRKIAERIWRFIKVYFPRKADD